MPDAEWKRIGGRNFNSFYDM